MHLKSLLFSGFAAYTLALEPSAGQIPAECTFSTLLPPTTMTKSDGTYTQTYTTTYTQLCSTGLRPETYTITETCSKPVCRYPEETALPPGFTTGAVTCDTCHSGGPGTTTLTIPLTSMTGHNTTAPTLSSAAPPAGSASEPVQAGANAIKLSLAVGALPPLIFIANLVL